MKQNTFSKPRWRSKRRKIVNGRNREGKEDELGKHRNVQGMALVYSR
jgi:hypothetical protein